MFVYIRVRSAKQSHLVSPKAFTRSCGTIHPVEQSWLALSWRHLHSELYNGLQPNDKHRNAFNRPRQSRTERGRERERKKDRKRAYTFTGLLRLRGQLRSAVTIFIATCSCDLLNGLLSEHHTNVFLMSFDIGKYRPIDMSCSDPLFRLSSCSWSVCWKDKRSPHIADLIEFTMADDWSFFLNAFSVLSIRMELESPSTPWWPRSVQSRGACRTYHYCALAGRMQCDCIRHGHTGRALDIKTSLYHRRTEENNSRQSKTVTSRTH